MNLDGTWLIGRATGAAASAPGFLALDHPTVSQRHAELLVLSGTYYLTDLGSRNGIWHRRNGRAERFHEGYVEPHEPLSFGRCEVRIGDLLAAALAGPR
ncbi:MAG: FHA domain-containing protein [Halofilum sp. (in: g-proteobacteria)]